MSDERIELEPSAIEGEDGNPRERGRDRGYVLAMAALLMLPLLAFAGFAVDVGAWYNRASQTQRAADAAALAGVKYLPNFANAETHALEAAARNGFVDGADDVTITVEEVAGSRLRVTIKDDDVERYFSSVVLSDVSIERRATAEYIKSVPMGSPRNYLGTGDQLSGSFRENFWLSVSGYCAKNEHGDRITPRADANGSGSNHSCNPGSPSYVRSNAEYRPDGYFYAMELDEDYAGSLSLQVFDGPHCQGTSYSGANDSGASTSAARAYDFIVRSNDSLQPQSALVLTTTRLTPSDCSQWGNRWKSLITLNGPTKGIYYVQVKPVIPSDTNGSDSQEGQNQFGLRVREGSTFSPCSADATVPGYRASPPCPRMYALTHLGVYAALVGANPSFYLASISTQHNGRTMELELFDSAEGAQGIELLDPNGNPVSVEWEVACKDGSYRSENGGSCATATGESAPSGGYGPGTTTKVDVAGSGTQPYSQLTQNGKYSNRILRLRAQLPDDMATAYGGRTWWRIRYDVGSATNLGDRTTWSVSITGDPIRLVPNS